MTRLLSVLFFFKRMYYPVILAIVCIALSPFYGFVSPVLFICLITIFDVIGWQELFRRFENIIDELLNRFVTNRAGEDYVTGFFMLFGSKTKEEIVDPVRTAYRIIQKMFEGICLISLFLKFGWLNALIAILMWIFGLSDGWHYWITKNKLEDHWAFRWMIFGWFQKEIPKWQVIMSMCFGVAFYIVYVLLKLRGLV